MRHLSFTQKYAIAEFIRKHRESLLNDRPTQAELAIKLTQHLGYPVGTHTVADVLATIGLKWTPATKPTNNVGHRTTQLRTDLDNLTADIAVLKTHVVAAPDLFKLQAQHKQLAAEIAAANQRLHRLTDENHDLRNRLRRAEATLARLESAPLLEQPSTTNILPPSTPPNRDVQT
jgi:hypothetical protein